MSIPSSNLPPVGWLQAFEAAARRLSFTRAAEELSVSQSAISQRIRLLEARVGQKLFIRHPRSLSLTEAGLAWLPSIEEAFSRLAQGTSEVFGPTPEGPVTIRATPALQQHWLAPRLATLHRQHPDLTFRVVTGIWAGDFNGDDVDMEIRYGQQAWPNLTRASLGAESMIPVCAPQLARQLASPGDLRGQTLLHANGFAVGWSLWFEHADAVEIESETHALWCDTQIMTLRLAEHGCGIALAHRRLLEKSSGLIAPFDIECPTEEQFWLTRPARRSMREPAARIWKYLLATQEDGVEAAIKA